jgi:hypothetical protein
MAATVDDSEDFRISSKDTFLLELFDLLSYLRDYDSI